MPKTSSNEYVVCPYCGEQHGDAWEWAAENTEGDRMECQGCAKVFVYWAEHDVTYYARDIEGGQLLADVLARPTGA